MSEVKTFPRVWGCWVLRHAASFGRFGFSVPALESAWLCLWLGGRIPLRVEMVLILFFAMEGGLNDSLWCHLDGSAKKLLFFI